jgi:hypothetical protein
MRSEQSKIQPRKSKAQDAKSPPPEKFKERDGRIDFSGTLGELRVLAKKTPYFANKAIMRAAIEALQCEGATSKTLARVSFGMQKK